MKKTKICKTCGTEIAKTAKHCPQCGAKQSSVGKAIAAVIAIFFLIGILVSLFGEGNTPELVSTNSPAPSDSVPPSEQPSVFGVGDTVSLNDINVTLVNVSENTGGNYMTPSNGKVFVVCEFEIENNSEQDIGVSSIMSFEAYIDDYSTAMNLSAMLSTDNTQLDGTVAPGKKMNGVIGYEAPNDWSSIEISFTPNFWSGKDITFTYSK